MLLKKLYALLEIHYYICISLFHTLSYDILKIFNNVASYLIFDLQVFASYYVTNNVLRIVDGRKMKICYILQTAITNILII